MLCQPPLRLLGQIQVAPAMWCRSTHLAHRGLAAGVPERRTGRESRLFAGSCANRPAGPGCKRLTHSSIDARSVLAKRARIPSTFLPSLRYSVRSALPWAVGTCVRLAASKGRRGSEAPASSARWQPRLRKQARQQHSDTGRKVWILGAYTMKLHTLLPPCLSKATPRLACTSWISGQTSRAASPRMLRFTPAALAS